MAYERVLGEMWKVYNVMDYGAKGDGIADDTIPIQNCFNDANTNRGGVVIPVPDNRYLITDTINILPGPSNQVFIDVYAHGWGGSGTNCIYYNGANDKAIFKIIGLKQSIWTGLKVGIAPGKSGIKIFDIDTTVAANSSSFVTFKNCYLNLVGINTVGFRTGHISEGGADISNYQWENCVIFGEKKSGQIAYLNEGRNTLSMTWLGGFTAQCYRLYSNLSQAGATDDRGNGSVFFYGMGASGNIVDYEFTFEQAYSVVGGRYESGGQFMRTPDGTHHPAITIINTEMNDYTGATMFDMRTAGTLMIQNCRMIQRNFESNLITLNAGINTGTLIVDGGGSKSTNLYQVQGGSSWKVYVRGVSKFSDSGGVFVGGHYIDKTAATS